MQVMLLYDLLEPYAVKAARTVLRREGTSNSSDLSDIGKGGDIIDFGMLYNNCSVSAVLTKLTDFQHHPTLSFHPPTISSVATGSTLRFAGEIKESTDSKIMVAATRVCQQMD